MSVYWRTKERELILPRHMDDSHLINAINMVARKTNNPLCTYGDWVKLAGAFHPMPYLMYEVFVRGLTDPFHTSLTDWASGYDDSYSYDEDDFGGGMPIDSDDWR